MFSIVKPLLRPIYRPLNRAYREFQFSRQRWALRQQAETHKRSGQLVRVGLGVAHKPLEGWLNTDKNVLDMTLSAHWQTIFQPRMVDRVLAEHVVEHLTIEQFRAFLNVVRPFLAADGFVRVAVPDGFHPDPAYIEAVRVGGTGKSADDHKVLYTYQLMTDVLSQADYEYRLLEYFDADGTFHKQDWLIEDGKVRRSAEFDRRNKEIPLSYTSLIVDFWPRS